MTTTQEFKRIAEATQDAFSRRRYTDAGWLTIARRLLHEGFTSAEAQWLLESKYMRWAADHANRSHSATAADFAKYVVETQSRLENPWQILLNKIRAEVAAAEVPKLQALANPATEDIADLIDLARTLKNIGKPSALAARASEILSRIERRAK